MLPIYSVILLSHWKKQNNVIWSDKVDLGIVILSEWSKIEEAKYYVISLTLESKKIVQWTDLQNRNRVTDIGNNLMVTKMERREGKLGDWDWHIHMNIYNIDN